MAPLLAERPAASAPRSFGHAPALFTRLLSWRPSVAGRAALAPDGTAISLADDGSAWHRQARTAGVRWAAASARGRGPAGMAWGPATGKWRPGTAYEWGGGFWRAPLAVQAPAAGPENTPGQSRTTTSCGGGRPRRGNGHASAVPAEVRARWPLSPRAALDHRRRCSARGRRPRCKASNSRWRGSPTRRGGRRRSWQAVPGVAAGSLVHRPDGTVYATAAADASLMRLDRREM